MRRCLPPAVLAIVGSIVPAMALAATARETNRIEFVRHLGPGWWRPQKELNELELSLIDTQQAAPRAATAVQND